MKQVADLYHEACAKYGKPAGRLMCSYFTHFADTPEQEAAQRARQIRYYKECVIPAFPGDPKTAPPSYRYFVDMVERLHKVKPEDLTENSVLLGSPAAHHRDARRRSKLPAFPKSFSTSTSGSSRTPRSRRRWTGSCARSRRPSRAHTSKRAA